jgi:hypothetical protein
MEYIYLFIYLFIYIYVMTHKWTRPLLFEEPRVLKYEELAPKPDQRFYPQKTNLILELKSRVFSSLTNENGIGTRGSLEK